MHSRRNSAESVTIIRRQSSRHRRYTGTVDLKLEKITQDRQMENEKERNIFVESC